ncbi:hypothetical protein L204_103409 [Cryptococcus depauperatus]|nr:hypothetical protein L204_01722 [Cryptococcus depauperatus CBS 7855]
MIIPPDPEKDPQIFSSSASALSIVAPTSEHSYFDGSAWDAESLPPYESRQRRSHAGPADGPDGACMSTEIGANAREGEVFSDANVARDMGERSRRPDLGLVIPANFLLNHGRDGRQSSPDSGGSSTPIGNVARGSCLPTFHATHTSDTLPQQHGEVYRSSSGNTAQGTSETAVAGSTSKLWEASSTQLPQNARVRKWWKKWRRWVQVFIILVLITMALITGLLVGMKHDNYREQTVSVPPWKDRSDGDGDGDDGRRTAAWAWDDGFNITYVESRDGPSLADGRLTTCNNFTPYDQTSSLSTLFTPFGTTSVSIATFSFPLQSNGSAPNFFIDTRGLGSSGKVSFIGAEASKDLKASGQENAIVVDVLVKYAGPQSLDKMMKVCDMARDDAVGIGIYSPRQTDNKISNRRILNPVYIPTHHIVIRVPPSVLNKQAPPVYFPMFTFNADQMSMKFGNLDQVIEFGDLDIDTKCGAINAEHVTLKTGNVVSKGFDFVGRWNVSEELRVNVSDGSISADVILHDPTAMDDNGTTLDTSLPNSNYQRRDKHAITAPNNLATTKSSRTIRNGFYTVSGSVGIRYLYHPTSITLSSIISTLRGPITVHMHPNYIGPFSTQAIWGEVNLPNPVPITSSDPSRSGRSRKINIGTINVQSNSSFARVGLNETVLANSTDTITGVAYWAETDSAHGQVKVKSVEEVQNEDAGENEVVVMGAWADVWMSFDGI